MQGKRIRNFASQVFDDENDSNEEGEGLETSSLVERFKFFATYEDRAKEEKKKPRKLFRITPPKDGEDQVDEELVKTHLPRPCMAINCAVCRLRVIFPWSLSCYLLSQYQPRTPNQPETRTPTSSRHPSPVYRVVSWWFSVLPSQYSTWEV